MATQQAHQTVDGEDRSAHAPPLTRKMSRVIRHPVI